MITPGSQDNDYNKVKPWVIRDNDDKNENGNEEEQRLAKLAKKQQQEDWKNAKNNHNVIKYMHYTNLATDQSSEVESLYFGAILIHTKTPQE